LTIRVHSKEDFDSVLKEDTSVVNALYQSDTDMDKFFEIAPDAKEQFESAELTGADITLNMEDYIALLSGQQDAALDFMNDFVKSQEGGITAEQARGFSETDLANEKIQDVLQEIRAEQAKVEQDIERQSFAQSVRDQIRGALVDRRLMGEKAMTADTADTMAGIYEAMVRTYSRITGGKSDEILKKIFQDQFEIRGPNVETAPNKRYDDTDIVIQRIKDRADENANLFERKERAEMRRAQREEEKKQEARRTGQVYKPSKIRQSKNREMPLTKLIAQRGIDPTGQLAVQIKALDITPQSEPWMFKKGGYQSADNIPAELVTDIIGEASGLATNVNDDNPYYADPQVILEVMENEIYGTGTSTQDSLDQMMEEIFNIAGVDITAETNPDDIRAGIQAVNDYYANENDSLNTAAGGLFQDAPSIDDFRESLIEKYDLKTLSMFESRGDLRLDVLITHKKDRNKGTGTKVMQEITDYADQNSLRILLSPAVQDDFQGTTSRSRLVKFYKRFGFVENKGRNKDFRISEGMYRDPETNTLFQSSPKTDTPEFKKWFNDSKVVDENGDPLVVYHGTTASNSIGGVLDFSDFRPFSHFGTVNAANERIDPDLYKMGIKSPRILPVYLSIKNPIRIEDSAAGHTIEDLAIEVENLDILPLDENGTSRIDYVLEPSDDAEKAGRLADEMLKAGYDGFVYENLVEDAGSTSYIVVDPSQVKSQFNKGTFDPYETNILFQGPKGFITRIGKDGESIPLDVDAGTVLIKMLEGADESTFMHESAHFFLDVVMRQVAKSDIADDRIRGDWKKTLDYLGVKTNDFDSIFDVKFTRKQQEKFAESFEAYLYEGKAPSSELRGTFQKLKFWMMDIYRNMRGKMKLNKEIQGVFDRLLATDQEINEALKEPIFTLGEQTMEMLNKQQQEALTKAMENDYEEAKRKLFMKAERERRRENTQKYKDEYQKIKSEVEESLKTQRIYKLHNFLTSGQDFDGNDIGDFDNFKINEKALAKALGVKKVDPLPRGVRGGKDGVDPAVLADLFGYPDVQSMALDLMNFKPMNLEVARQTDETLYNRYGNMLDPQIIKREAFEMVMQEVTSVDAMILETLSEKTGAAYPADGDFKKAAQIAIADLSMEVARKPNKYYQAALKAEREYGQALGKKDYIAAAEAKRRVLLNKHMYTAARDVRNDSEKALKKFQKLNKWQKRGKATKRPSIDQDYLVRIWDLLDKYDLGPQMSAKKRDRILRKAQFTTMAELQTWMDGEMEEGATFMMPPELVQADQKIHYTQLTVAEFDALKDLVANLEHQGRLKTKLIIDGQTRDLRKTRMMLQDAAERNLPIFERIEGRGMKQGVQKFWRNLDATSTKTSQFMAELDGGDNFGIWTQTVYEPMQKAEINRNTRSRTEYDNLREIYDKWGEKEAYNSETRGFSPEFLENALGQMRKKDWQLVMDLRDYLDTFWNETSAVEKRRFGWKPEKMEAGPDTQWITAEGEPITVRGGYMRIKYDPDQDARANQQNVDEHFEDMKMGQSTRTMMKRGAMIERVQGVKKPIKLDLNVINEHVAEQVSLITMAETVDNVQKLLKDPIVSQTVFDRLGKDKQTLLDLWLKDTAVGGVLASGEMNNTIARLRRNYTIGRLGLRPMTAMLQFSGLAHTIAGLGAKNTMKGLAGVFRRGNPWNAVADIEAKSEFMKERRWTLTRDVQAALQEYTQRGNTYTHKISALMMLPMQKMQAIVDGTTWLAAYEDAQKRGLDEDKAIRFADLQVSRLQASGLTSDLAAVERGTWNAQTQRQELVKSFTMFYSYFNAKYNLMKNTNTKFRNKEINMGELMASHTLTFLVEGMIAAAIMQQIDWDDDDDGEVTMGEIGLAMFKTSRDQATALLPFVREVGGAWQGFSAGGAADAQLESLGKGIGTIGGVGEKLVTGEDVNEYQTARSLTNLANVFVPLPAGAINQILRAEEKRANGEDVSLIEYFVYQED